jgi:hypothetical protein
MRHKDSVVRCRPLVEAAAWAGARTAAVEADEDAVRAVALAAAPDLDPALAGVVIARQGTQGDPSMVSGSDYRVDTARPLRNPLRDRSIVGQRQEAITEGSSMRSSVPAVDDHARITQGGSKAWNSVQERPAATAP